MKNVMILLAIATIPVTAGCNCCGLGACPCNPCSWFNRGAYCGPTPTYSPIAAAPCPPMASPCPSPCGPVASTVMPQYPVPMAAPMAAAPMAPPYAAAPGVMGAPMMAAPPYGYAQTQPMYYAEPTCGYAAEPTCGYAGAVSYGPSFPVDMGGCPGGACEGGSYDGSMMGGPTESIIMPMPGE